MPDPFLALQRAASHTQRIELGTGIALVPERNPLLAAEEIATMDHYSKGRVATASALDGTSRSVRSWAAISPIVGDTQRTISQR